MIPVVTSVLNSLYDWLKYDCVRGGLVAQDDWLVFTTDEHDPADGHTYNLMVWRYRGIPIAKFYLGIRKIEFIFSANFPKDITYRLNSIWQLMADLGMTAEYHSITYVIVDDEVGFTYIDDNISHTHCLTGSDTSSFFLPWFTDIKREVVTVTVPMCDDTRGLL